MVYVSDFIPLHPIWKLLAIEDINLVRPFFTNGLMFSSRQATLLVQLIADGEARFLSDSCKLDGAAGQPAARRSNDMVGVAGQHWFNVVQYRTS
ncbi:hypothetical protein EVAR_27487_1 [Eumeta japonica]|uniref:Uncharacterized protein n=1 Tax=Eumeta variegata TaxID=151549 RepID=A0A4C1XET5_EUMVA|nr:hypothetical protein EVAR_27487_1 [Eumeta japonica]